VPFARPAPARRVALAYRRSFPRPAAIAALRESVAECRGVKDKSTERDTETQRG
jgi:LysR family hydrogen peroxide-inducible transcriptional activator